MDSPPVPRSFRTLHDDYPDDGSDMISTKGELAHFVATLSEREAEDALAILRRHLPAGDCLYCGTKVVPADDARHVNGIRPVDGNGCEFCSPSDTRRDVP
jgi:hypothetical protein